MPHQALGLLAAISAVSLTAVVSVGIGQDKSTLVRTPAQRGFWESKKYAGKVMDLILPWIHHRVDATQFLTVSYNSRTVPSPCLAPSSPRSGSLHWPASSR